MKAILLAGLLARSTNGYAHTTPATKPTALPMAAGNGDCPQSSTDPFTRNAPRLTLWM